MRVNGKDWVSLEMRSLLFPLFTMLLLLMSHSAVSQTLSDEDVKGMATQVASIFEIYMTNFTGHKQAQELFDHALLSIETVDGTVHSSSVATRIENVLGSYEQLLFQFRDKLLREMGERTPSKKWDVEHIRKQARLSEAELQQVEGWSFNISLERDVSWLPESWAIDDDDDDEMVRADFSWSSSLREDWSQSLSEDAAKYPDVHSLYFGAASGLVRMYPGRVRQSWMDSREMPWYVGPATPRKDVVFVLDLSQAVSQEWDDIRRGVSSVIHSLTAEDFVQVVITQGKGRAERFSCASSKGLTRATLDTKWELLQWLEQLKPEGKADLEAAVVELYDIFFEALGGADNVGLRSNSSNCVKVAFLIAGTSDAVYTDLDSLILSIDRELEVTIHSWLVGKAIQDAKDLAEDDIRHSSGGFYDTSCSHDGVWNMADSDISRQLLESYRYLVAGFTRERPLWQLGLGADYSLQSMNESRPVLLSASLPIYSPEEDYPVLLAVVGLDIRFDSLLTILESEQIGLSYAFLTSRFGETVSHPRAPDVSESKQLPGALFYDIQDIETSFQLELENQKNVRALLVQELAGNATFVVDLPIPRGDTGEGFVLRREPVHFFWTQVNNSPFIAVVALTEENLVKRILEAASPVQASLFQNAHLMQEKGELAFLPPGFYFSVIPELLQYNILGASFTHSSVSGTYHKGLFGDWPTYFQKIRDGDTEAARLGFVHLNGLSVTAAMLAETNMSRAELNTNPVFGRDIKNMVQLTAGMDAFWRQMEALAYYGAFYAELRGSMLWSVLGTDAGGLLRTWPGFPQSYHDSNPISATWYQRAVSAPGLYALSQPFISLGEDDDPDKTIGRVITLSTALYYNSSDRSAGIAGAITSYFNYGRLYNATLGNLGCPVDRLNNGGIQCLLLGPDGSMLMMPEFTSSDRFTFLDNSQKTPNDLLFLGDREPELADQLIDSGFLKLLEQKNYRTQRVEYSYTVRESGASFTGSLSMDSSRGYCTTASSVHITPIENSNVHLIVFQGYYYSDQNCSVTAAPTSRVMSQDTCELNEANLPRPQPECSVFRVSEEILEDKLRLSDSAKCEQSENPELVWIEWSDTAAIIVTALTAVCFLFTLLILIMLAVYRKEPVVRYSSPLFVYFMHLGAFLAYPAILLGIGKPSSVSCNFQLWLGVLAFLFLFGCLSVKTLRVWMITRGLESLKINILTTGTLLKYLLALSILPLIVLILWSSLNPLEDIVYDDNVDSDKETLRCGSSDDLLSFIFGGILAAYAVGIMLFVAFLAFKVRDSVLGLKDSKLMAGSIYNFMLLSTTAVILSLVLRGTPVAAFLVLSIGILLAVFGCIVILFLPKLYIIFFAPSQNKKPGFTDSGHASANNSTTQEKSSRRSIFPYSTRGEDAFHTVESSISQTTSDP